MKNHHHVSLTAGALKDCDVWLTFLKLSKHNPLNLSRPFVDVDSFQYATTLGFWTDASLSHKLGMGAVFNNNWLVQKWGSEFIRTQKPSIEFLELYALTVGILTWSTKLQNMRIIIFCDNEAVIQMVNNMTSKCPKCMKLIRLLALDGMISNRRVFVRYISSKSNILADSLSRMKFKTFWKNAPPTINKFPDTIHKEIWPIEKIWFDNA